MPTGRTQPRQVRTDQLALLFALVIAIGVVLLIVLELLLRWRAAHARPAASPGSNGTSDGSALQHLLSANWLPRPIYRRLTRVVSVVFIGTAMGIVVVTGPAEATAIVVLLAFSLILIELLQDVLPSTAFGRLRLPLEAVVVLVLLTTLVALTGGATSMYFFGYILLVAVAALSVSELAAAILALSSSAAYLIAIAAASNGQPLTTTEAGVVAFNLVSIALATYFGSMIGREHRRARSAALELVRFDPLTGVLTKRFFDIALESEILRSNRNNRQFSVILSDLDGLKFVNDTYGYDAGDRLIKFAADAITSVTRATDTVARNSTAADEFFVLLPETDAAGADVVAENIRAKIEVLELSFKGAPIRSTASLGVVTFADDGQAKNDLMEHGADAVHMAKKLGKNRVRHYQPSSRPLATNTDAGQGTPAATPGRAPWEAA
jgi:diguanylate cyclase (GGDEF)-like protein